MSKPDAATLLKERILVLEAKQANEYLLLKEQLAFTYESLKPASIIKSTLHDILASRELHKDLTEVVIGIAARFISKKIDVATSTPPAGALRQVLGVVLQVAVSSLLAKYSDKIRTTVSYLISMLSDQFMEKEKEEVDGEVDR
jgi:hypothetical protein